MPTPRRRPEIRRTANSGRSPMDTGYWELVRSVRGDWIVFDVRDDTIIKRFASADAAQGWFDDAVGGDRR